MFCKNCSQPVTAQAAFCGSCGRPVHQPVPSHKLAYLLGGSAAVTFIITTIALLALSVAWPSADRADGELLDEMVASLSESSVTGEFSVTPMREENHSPTPHTASTPQPTATRFQSVLTPELIIQTPLPPQAIDELQAPLELLAGVWYGSASGRGEWTDPWTKNVRFQVRSFCRSVGGACLIDLQDGEIHRLDDAAIPDGYCFIDQAQATWRCVYEREDGNLEYNAQGPLWGESGVLYREGLFDCSQVTAIPISECEALVGLYNNTDGLNWIDGSGWLADYNPCNWFGVMCRAGHVTELRLEGYREENQLIRFGLNGDIPPEMGNLTNLSRLDLRSNQLRGSIPRELGNLANLWHLSLENNRLSGSIPEELGRLSNLQHLNLGDNQLSGSIPNELGNLTRLRGLFLYRNNLSEGIPAALANLTNLDWLSLWNNQLSGSIPAELGNLTNLQRLELGGNQLSGSIPAELGNLTNLQRLELSSNQLSGSIPPELGNLARLEGMSLFNNRLSSSIPVELGNLVNLENLYLWDNQLSGSIPSELGNLASLQQMLLDRNQLNGPIPPELGNLTNLRRLSLSGNRLNGDIPIELGNLASLRELQLPGNQLSGSIPPELGNLADLDRLDLSRNQLRGSIPQEFSGLSNLSWFWFYNTSVCTPDNAAMHDWLAGISQLYGTGQVCGQPAAAITGIITNNEGTPLANAEVVLYRDTSVFWSSGSVVSVVMRQSTDGDGRYQFGELGQGISYYLHFRDSSGSKASEYFEDKVTISSADPITLTLGATRVINAQLSLPTPPLVDVIVHNSSFTTSTDPATGITHITAPIGSSVDITFSRAIVCDDGSVPEAVTLSYRGETFGLIVNNDIYTATIRDTDVDASGAVTFRTTCVGEESSTMVARVTRYQPGGRITDAATGMPVEGASVTLYQVPDWEPKANANDVRPNTCQSQQSKPTNVPWNQPAPTHLGIVVNAELTMVAPRISVQQTNDAGYYGWDVPASCWYVIVEAEGYEPFTSPVVGVSPRITDLDVTLTPINRQLFLPPTYLLMVAIMLATGGMARLTPSTLRLCMRYIPNSDNE